MTTRKYRKPATAKRARRVKVSDTEYDLAWGPKTRRYVARAEYRDHEWVVIRATDGVGLGLRDPLLKFLVEEWGAEAAHWYAKHHGTKVPEIRKGKVRAEELPMMPDRLHYRHNPLARRMDFKPQNCAEYRPNPLDPMMFEPRKNDEDPLILTPIGVLDQMFYREIIPRRGQGLGDKLVRATLQRAMPDRPEYWSFER